MKNNPKVVSVDIDGFLTKETCWTEDDMRNATPRQEVVDWLREYYKKNFIVLYTARRDPFYEVTIEWLRKYNIPYHVLKMGKLPSEEYWDNSAFNLEDM